jgi:NAD+ diphosphatase
MGLFDNAVLTAPADLGFATAELDRAAERRDDAEWQKAALARARSRFLLLCNDCPVIDFAGERLEAMFDLARATATAPFGEALFLGLKDGEAVFGLNLDPDAFESLKERADLKLIDMRSIAVQGLFPPGTINAIGTAKSMFQWHLKHRFCSACGAPSRMTCSGWKRTCDACKAEHFPRTDPVVIMLAVDGDRCLMGRAPRFPEKMYSCLAGFMEPGETFEDATRREILEEAGIHTGRVRYLMAQPWPFPMSLMIGCIAEATSTEITIGDAELADARWFTRDEVKLILRNEHPDGIMCPPSMAIANHIMRAFADATE